MNCLSELFSIKKLFLRILLIGVSEFFFSLFLCLSTVKEIQHLVVVMGSELTANIGKNEHLSYLY